MSRYKIEGNEIWEFYDKPNFEGLLFTATGPVGWTMVDSIDTFIRLRLLELIRTSRTTLNISALFKNLKWEQPKFVFGKLFVFLSRCQLYNIQAVTTNQIRRLPISTRIRLAQLSSRPPIQHDF